MKIRWSACKLADDRAGRGGGEANGVLDWRASSQLLHRNVQRFRGGLVFEAHRLCVSLNSRLESNKEEEEVE